MRRFNNYIDSSFLFGNNLRSVSSNSLFNVFFFKELNLKEYHLLSL